jgi:hypothetical protein
MAVFSFTTLPTEGCVAGNVAMDTLSTLTAVDTPRVPGTAQPWRALLGACQRHGVAIMLVVSLGAILGWTKATYWPVWEARAFVKIPETSSCGFPRRQLASNDPALIAAYFSVNYPNDPFAQRFAAGTLSRNQLAAVVTQTTGVLCGDRPLEVVVRWRESNPETARRQVASLTEYLRDAVSHPSVLALLDEKARQISTQRDRATVMLESQREQLRGVPTADAQNEITRLEGLLRKLDADANVARETLAAAHEPGFLGRRVVARMSQSADHNSAAVAFDREVARQFRMEWIAEERQVEKLTWAAVTSERVMHVSPALLWTFIGAGLGALVAATALFGSVVWSRDGSFDTLAT